MFELIRSDLQRYYGKTGLREFLFCLFFNNGFKYTLALRLSKKSIVFRLFMIYFSQKYLIDISPETNIGKGIYLGHAMGIVISEKAIIGDNCNISQFVTIGQKKEDYIRAIQLSEAMYTSALVQRLSAPFMSEMMSQLVPIALSQKMCQIMQL